LAPSAAAPRRPARSSGRRASVPRPNPAVPPAGGAAAADDAIITALSLEAARLSPAMAAYFDKRREKLGFVPNVLEAYSFNMPKRVASATDMRPNSAYHAQARSK